MLTRVQSLRPVAAAVSLALLPFASARAAEVHSVPLKIDFSLTAAQIDDSCKFEIVNAGKRIDALVHARSARTFKTVVEPLENTVSDLADNLGAQVLLFNVAPDKAVRDASERCNTAVTGFLAISFLIKFLQRYSTMVFIVYRLFLGISILLLIVTGVK